MRQDFGWQTKAGARRYRPGRRGRAPAAGRYAGWFAAAALAGWILAGKVPHRDAGPDATARQFGLCFTGGGTNCVVDGDTFWIDGTKVRIADIDAPETHPPRCASEAERGDRATQRLQALLNDGPVALTPIDRDEDRYGRKLRIVTRDGASLGGTLVSEGLARPWDGARHPWC